MDSNGELAPAIAARSAAANSKPHFGIEVLVPENQVTSADLRRVQLSCSRAELESMERFERRRLQPGPKAPAGTPARVSAPQHGQRTRCN